MAVVQPTLFGASYCWPRAETANLNLPAIPLAVINAPPVQAPNCAGSAGGLQDNTGSDFRLEMIGTDQCWHWNRSEHSMLNAISVTGRRHLHFMDRIIVMSSVGIMTKTLLPPRHFHLNSL